MDVQIDSPRGPLTVHVTHASGRLTPDEIVIDEITERLQTGAPAPGDTSVTWCRSGREEWLVVAHNPGVARPAAEDDTHGS